MELRELRSLVALAELNSLTKAADRLNLSPAAIHKQLKVLEDELGVRLYEKIGRGLQLTQAAFVLLPHLKEMLAQHDAAVSALAEWKGMKRGLVRIGAGPAMSCYILTPLIKKFRKSHRDVDLFVQTGNTVSLLESISRGTLDLALLVSPDVVEAPGFEVNAYWDFEMVVVSHLPQTPQQCRLADLKSFPFILYQKGSRMEESVDRYFAANAFQPRVIMRFDNADAIKGMVQAGLGLSMLPMWIVDADVKSGRLSVIRQEEPKLLSHMALVTRKSSYTPSAVQAFLDETRAFEWKRPRLTAPAHAPARKHAVK